MIRKHWMKTTMAGKLEWDGVKHFRYLKLIVMYLGVPFIFVYIIHIL